eukprot:TRINITY_DN5944_c0_g1_i2.p1 TRINITY_DN5944_c0_g1~~TRINITY_DN5944_c0_g1_i2.p1  ORF type:complete len:407 (+),score=116.23 TRINITY_DN5944_c0_g1_i2:55-1275(+)
MFSNKEKKQMKRATGLITTIQSVFLKKFSLRDEEEIQKWCDNYAMRWKKDIADFVERYGLSSRTTLHNLVKGEFDESKENYYRALYQYYRACELGVAIADVKFILIGVDADGKGAKESVQSFLRRAFVENNFIKRLLGIFSDLEFETRKDLVDIVCSIIEDENEIIVDYIVENKDVLIIDLLNYTDDLRRNILKEVARTRDPVLYECFFEESILGGILSLVENNDITGVDVLVSILDDNKNIENAASYLLREYEQIFPRVITFVTNEEKNLLARVKLLEALGGIMINILSERAADDLIVLIRKFLSIKSNLTSIMGLLFNESMLIKRYAYDIFKVFIIAPIPEADVRNVLLKNQKSIINFLKETDFAINEEIGETAEDLAEEKLKLIDQMRKLAPMESFEDPNNDD